jgi:hypothetical protein
MLKYLIQGVIVYLLFKYVPKQSMNDRDVMMITAIIVLAYAAFDNALLLFSKDSGPSESKCSSVCASREGMETVSPSVDKPLEIRVEPKVATNPEPTVVSEPSPTSDVGVDDNENSDQSSNQVSSPESSEGSDDGFQSYIMKPYVDSNNRTGSRYKDDVITNEMEYTDFNTLPVPTNLSNYDFEYGDSFLPPDKWYPVPPHPPVCVSEKRCPVCPITTIGTPVDVKEWDQSRRITPPDSINVKYVKEKLNSGR